MLYLLKLKWRRREWHLHTAGDQPDRGGESMRSITETEGGVVYMLTSPSGRRYVGQTWNLLQRMAKYKCGGDKAQPAIYNAIAKHGWDNFVVVIIVCGIQTQDALDATEKAFIALLNTLSPHGYNLTVGGVGGKPSSEARAKMSAAAKGRTHSPETRAKMSAAKCGENNPNYGKAHSPEHRAKLSDAMSGENNPYYGKTLSQEHRAKLSAARKAYWDRKRRDESSAQTTLEIEGLK